MPLISVIVPVYKVEPYLNECVDSILAQTFSDFELILVDDGSPDNCPAICDEYAAKDRRVVTIHKDNGGQASARNVALDYIFANSNSKYISFVDSDDIIDKTFLEKLVFAIQGNDLSVCYYQEFDENGYLDIDGEMCNATVGRKDYWKIKQPLSCYASLGIICNKLFSRQLFEKIRFPIVRRFEDDYVIYKIIDLCSSVQFVGEALYFYRRRQDSTMGRIDKESIEYKIDVLNLECDKVKYYLNCCPSRLDDYSFHSAIKILISIYGKHSKFVKDSFKFLKDVYKKNKISHFINGLDIFFTFPRLYCFFKNLPKKQHF